MHETKRSNEILSIFDERQQEVVATGAFWCIYKDEIRELFFILGKEQEWSENPEDWLPMVRRQWIGKEHGYSTDKELFTDQQVTAALEILAKMGFSAELLPPPGHYQQLVILGGTTPALQKRMASMTNYAITFDEVAVLAGQRPVDEKRDGTKQELLSNEDEFSHYDISIDPWAAQALGGDRQLFEIDMAITALKKKYGSISPNKITLELLDVTNLTFEEMEKQLPQKMGEIPPRLAIDYHFSVPEKVVILNGKAVERKQGAPRPTTESTLNEWLERLAPTGSIEEPARVVVVSSNPHTLRMVEEMQRMLRLAGRHDIALIPAGPASNGMSIEKLQTALGEIGRLIDNDPTAHVPAPTHQ